MSATRPTTATGWVLRTDIEGLTARLEPNGVSLPVVRIGLDELVVGAPVPWDDPGPTPVTLHLGPHTYGPIDVLVLGQELRLSDASPRTLRAIGGALREALRCSLVVPTPTRQLRQEVIRDPAAISARLRGLAAHRSAVRVLGPVGGRSTLLPSSRGLAVLTGLLPGPDVVEVQVVGFTSVYRAALPVIAAVPEGLVVGVPAALTRIQHRESQRAAAPPGTRVRFRHPSAPHQVVDRRVVDVSRNGIGALARLDEDGLQPGMLLPEVEILIPGSPPLRFAAEVRVLLPSASEEQVCGLRLTGASDVDALRWRERVGDMLLPTTRTGGIWSEDLWDLYEASGYFSLSGKSPAFFAPLRRPFATAVRKLDRDARIGVQVSWPSSRGVEASLTLIRAFTHAWMAFQMAKRPGEPADGGTARQVLQETLLRAYDHAQGDPNLRWIMAFIQDSARWSRLVHYDLPQRYVDTGQAAIVPFHTFLAEMSTRPAVGPGDVVVGPATPAEVERLLADLARRRPSAWCESLDLVPERVRLDQLCAAWSRAGLARERHFSAARADGELLAVSMLEAAEPGLHLFGLFDATRFWGLTPTWRSAIPALVHDARSWYSIRSRTMFSLLLEEVRAEDVQGLGLMDLGGASFTVMSTELLSTFLEHVVEVTAPRTDGG